MTESEVELSASWWKWKRRVKSWLFTLKKINIQKTKIMASSAITLWQINGGKSGTVTDFIFLGSKITVDGDCSHGIKRCLLLGKKATTNLDSILKSRDTTLLTTTTKVCYSQSYAFSSNHVWMWESDLKEVWESLGLQGDPTSQS